MRITTKQNEIYKAHVNAWRTRNFNFDKDDTNVTRDDLNNGLTSELLWNRISQDINVVSITSQIAMSDSVLGHLTNNAQVGIRNEFKRLLNKLEIR